MNRQEAINKTVELRNKKFTWGQISQALNKAGYVSEKYKKPLSDNGSYFLHPENMVKAKKSAAKFYKKKRQVTAPITGTTSKWDLLKTIDNCTDLKPSVKKSLMSMVFDETCN